MRELSTVVRTCSQITVTPASVFSFFVVYVLLNIRYIYTIDFQCNAYIGITEVAKEEQL